MNNKFNEEDKKKFIEFLNFIAKKAEFTMNTQDALDYCRLLAHMQQSVLAKIESNILELLEIKQNPPSLPVEK